MPHDGLLDGVRVRGDLVSDRRPDKIGAVGVEALLHQQIDMAEVDESDVDRDFLGFARLVAQSVYLSRHSRPRIIQMDGMWMEMARLQEARIALERVLDSSLRLSRKSNGPTALSQGNRAKDKIPNPRPEEPPHAASRRAVVGRNLKVSPRCRPSRRPLRGLLRTRVRDIVVHPIALYLLALEGAFCARVC